jgi:putative hydrolase
MKKKLKIYNPDLDQDFHIHSINFSDGMNTVDELVAFAGTIGLKKIAITDHSQAMIKKPLNFYRFSQKIYKNMYNNVEVIFGVEADLLNKEGDACFTIDDIEPKHINLSCHLGVYKEDPKTITQGFCKAIERFSEKLFCISHLHTHKTHGLLDIKKIIKTANKHKVMIELNGSYLSHPKHEELAHIICQNADVIVINSDAHCLAQLKENPKKALAWLKKNNYT